MQNTYFWNLYFHCRRQYCQGRLCNGKAASLITASTLGTLREFFPTQCCGECLDAWEPLLIDRSLAETCILAKEYTVQESVLLGQALHRRGGSLDSSVYTLQG